MNKPRIAIFASGRGSNATAIHQYSIQNPEAFKVALILSNREKAGVMEYGKNHNIPTVHFTRNDFYQTKNVIENLEEAKIDLIVLAGFLWLIPPYLVEEFPECIVNIHPAILPKFGGKGMYGKYVHEAVSQEGETSSGITIHLVNEKYDDGSIIFQSRRAIEPNEAPEIIAEKVLELEHHFYPKVIHGLCNHLYQASGMT